MAVAYPVLWLLVFWTLHWHTAPGAEAAACGSSLACDPFAGEADGAEDAFEESLMRVELLQTYLTLNRRSGTHASSQDNDTSNSTRDADLIDADVAAVSESARHSGPLSTAPNVGSTGIAVGATEEPVQLAGPAPMAVEDSIPAPQHGEAARQPLQPLAPRASGLQQGHGVRFSGRRVSTSRSAAEWRAGLVCLLLAVCIFGLALALQVRTPTSAGNVQAVDSLVASRSGAGAQFKGRAARPPAATGCADPDAPEEGQVLSTVKEEDDQRILKGWGSLLPSSGSPLSATPCPMPPSSTGLSTPSSSGSVPAFAGFVTPMREACETVLTIPLGQGSERFDVYDAEHRPVLHACLHADKSSGGVSLDVLGICGDHEVLASVVSSTLDGSWQLVAGGGKARAVINCVDDIDGNEFLKLNNDEEELASLTVRNTNGELRLVDAVGMQVATGKVLAEEKEVGQLLELHSAPNADPVLGVCGILAPLLLRSKVESTEQQSDYSGTGSDLHSLA